MTDNYTLFSEVVEALTQEEIDWLKQQLEYVPRGDQDDIPRFMHEAIAAGDDELLEPDCGRNFDFEFQDCSLWLYSDECGSPAHAAVLVQRFLKRFRPQDYWLINWAATSSRLQNGEFGGGGMLVAANQICAESGWSFVDRKLEELGLAGKVSKSPEGFDGTGHRKQDETKAIHDRECRGQALRALLQEPDGAPRNYRLNIVVEAIYPSRMLAASSMREAAAIEQAAYNADGADREAAIRDWELRFSSVRPEPLEAAAAEYLVDELDENGAMVDSAWYRDRCGPMSEHVTLCEDLLLWDRDGRNEAELKRLLAQCAETVKRSV